MFSKLSLELSSPDSTGSKGGMKVGGVISK